MGDHFVLLVDRLLPESTIEATIESGNRSQQATPSANEDRTAAFSTPRMDKDLGSSPSKFVECRICHDEDEDSNMEMPCSCCGTLKYAHRKCVQRWCNEKGDTTCEICLQQYKPGYSASPPLFHYGDNFRANLEDMHNPQFLTMVTGEHEFPDSDFGNMVTGENEFPDSDFDEYYTPSSRSIICCRIVAKTFMVLLVLRHTLPIIISGAEEYSLTLFTLRMLRTIGILLLIYVMVKAFIAIQRRRRHQQDSRFTLASSDEENELPRQQHTPLRFIRP